MWKTLGTVSTSGFASCVAEDELYVYGGVGKNGACSELRCWGPKGTWEVLASGPKHGEGCLVYSEEMACLVLVSGKLSGFNRGERAKFFDGLWCYDMKSGLAKETLLKGEPLQLHGNTACSLLLKHPCVLLFGGLKGNMKKYTNDLHVVDLMNNTVRVLSTNTYTGTPPLPRAHHSSAIIDAHFFTAGGTSYKGTCKDVHRLHLPTMVWQEVALKPQLYRLCALGERLLAVSKQGSCIYEADTEFVHYESLRGRGGHARAIGNDIYDLSEDIAATTFTSSGTADSNIVLPKDAWQAVVRYLAVVDIVRLGLTCRTLKQLTYSINLEGVFSHDAVKLGKASHLKCVEQGLEAITSEGGSLTPRMAAKVMKGVCTTLRSAGTDVKNFCETPCRVAGTDGSGGCFLYNTNGKAIELPVDGQLTCCTETNEVGIFTGARQVCLFNATTGFPTMSTTRRNMNASCVKVYRDMILLADMLTTDISVWNRKKRTWEFSAQGNAGGTSSVLREEGSQVMVTAGCYDPDVLRTDLRVNKTVSQVTMGTWQCVTSLVSIDQSDEVLAVSGYKGVALVDFRSSSTTMVPIEGMVKCLAKHGEYTFLAGCDVGPHFLPMYDIRKHSTPCSVLKEAEGPISCVGTAHLKDSTTPDIVVATYKTTPVIDIWYEGAFASLPLPFAATGLLVSPTSATIASFGTITRIDFEALWPAISCS
eukprot:TRINITY_DN7226_c0_g2_i1.p1 TRINITY_DN7226_c0_g2~~TRINITY_DN7226_c0_g2_i1.p1  ORF type:complete len:704 (+),score=136.06 TRINITY_DN7226_c0_g2_i1:34-2145(+)